MKEPKVIERFADNGEHSHWQLIDENGEILWSEEPTEVKNNAVLPHVSGSAWDLPDGVYQVGVDKAAKGSKDYSTRIWMKKGISGEMIIVAEEHYR